jgi:2-oxo-3-hexenedioate decarboxylase
MTTIDTRELALEMMEARAAGKAVESRPSSRDSEFDLPAAYKVETELAELRRAEGHKTTGRKIGFTNRAVWPKLDLDTIVWGYVFDDTVHFASGNHFILPIGNLVAPRIEPEIMFKLKSNIDLETASDPVKVLEAVEWIALGFEIVDCPYPNWRYRPADMVAAFAFHGALVIGDPHPLKNLPQLAEQFANFKLRLLKNGETAAEGGGKNVYDSPALCLGQLARTIAAQSGVDPLVAGEIISSGTLTDAQPVAVGEEWAAITEGLNVPTISIKFVS